MAPANRQQAVQPMRWEIPPALAENALCFRPLEPKLEAGPHLVWKRYQVFSEAAGVFLDKLRTKFAE